MRSVPVIALHGRPFLFLLSNVLTDFHACLFKLSGIRHGTQEPKRHCRKGCFKARGPGIRAVERITALGRVSRQLNDSIKSLRIRANGISEGRVWIGCGDRATQSGPVGLTQALFVLYLVLLAGNGIPGEDERVARFHWLLNGRGEIEPENVAASGAPIYSTCSVQTPVGSSEKSALRVGTVRPIEENQGAELAGSSYSKNRPAAGNIGPRRGQKRKEI